VSAFFTLAIVACGPAAVPTPTLQPTFTPAPTPNIEATVEARLQATLATMPTPITIHTPTSISLIPMPTPTPDVPRFVDGEAIAVVKTWLSGMTYETERTRLVGNCTELQIIRGRAEGECVESAVVVQHNCLVQYQVFEWSSAYLGNGVWSVTAQLEQYRQEWRVFEGTSAIESVKVKGRCG